MATPTEDLETAITNIAARLAALTAYDHPNISIDGVSYQTSEYRSSLIADLEKLQEVKRLIAGPWMVSSRGII